jgi:hypothetical protein
MLLRILDGLLNFAQFLLPAILIAWADRARDTPGTDSQAPLATDGT